MILVLIWYLSFNHLPTAVTSLPCAFHNCSDGFSSWYLDFPNLNAVIYWQLGHIILLLTLLYVNAQPLLIFSSATAIAYRIIFKTTIFKNLNGTSIIIFCLSESRSVIFFSLLSVFQNYHR